MIIFPGAINTTLGVLNVNSASFIKEETVYEILLEIRFSVITSFPPPDTG